MSLPEADFLARAAALPADPEARTARARELYLALACGQGAPAALRAFEARFMPAAARALARFSGGRSFVADALQELRMRLFVGPPPRILEYSGNGSLEAWVKVTAVRVAINLRQRDHRHRPVAFDSAAEPPLEGMHDAELDLLKVRYRDEVQAALREAFGALTAADRSLLRLYVIDTLNIAEIGRIVGKSRATVGRLVIEVRQRLLTDTRARLASSLQVARGDLDSVFRLVRSQLDVTLSALLAP